MAKSKSPIIRRGSETKQTTPQTSAQSLLRPDSARIKPAPLPAPKRTPANPPGPRNANPVSRPRKK
jgi:hypothetical protein